MRKQRDREKLEEYREKRDNQFQYKSIPDIEKFADRGRKLLLLQ